MGWKTRREKRRHRECREAAGLVEFKKTPIALEWRGDLNAWEEGACLAVSGSWFQVRGALV